MPNGRFLLACWYRVNRNVHNVAIKCLTLFIHHPHEAVQRNRNIHAAIAFLEFPPSLSFSLSIYYASTVIVM